MTHARYVSGMLTLAVAAVALFLSTRGTDAEDPAAPAQSATAPPPSDTPEKPANPYAVPQDATPEALRLFVLRLLQAAPPERTRESYVEHFKKADKAAEEVLAAELDDETRLAAVHLKFRALTFLDQLGEETAAQQRTDFIATLTQDPRPEIASEGKKLSMIARIESIEDLEPAARQKLVDDVAAFLQEPDLDENKLRVAMHVAGQLEHVDSELAVAAYNVFIKNSEHSTEEAVVETIDAMRGSLRRLQLPGNSIEIAGMTVTGEAFDIKQYAGKVVLVDFWATWCGPCIGELPNVIDNYKKYHGKGFEIVGISLDDSPEELTQFIADREIPWVTLFPTDEDVRGWKNPIARHYGIHGIPTVILVNQAGKVVSMEARGEELGTLLAELLGPPLEVPEEKPADAADKPDPDKPDAGNTANRGAAAAPKP